MPTADQILDTPLPADNESGAATIRGYLVELLLTLWREGDGFSGKRPFGDSGWEWDLYAALVRAGHVEGTFDEDGYLEELTDAERVKADRLVAAAIESLADLRLRDTATTWWSEHDPAKRDAAELALRSAVDARLTEVIR